MMAQLGLTPRRSNETPVTTGSGSRNSSDSNSALDTAMTYVAPRACTVVSEGQARPDAKERTPPLSGYANAMAYVLIAEPGVGKTTAFETEVASRRVICHSLELADFRRQAGVAGQNALSGWARRVARWNTGWPDAARRHPEEAEQPGVPSLPAVLAGGPTGRRQTTRKH